MPNETPQPEALARELLSLAAAYVPLNTKTRARIDDYLALRLAAVSNEQQTQAIERLRIMAKQKLPDEMNDEDRQSADYEFGYVEFCREARAVYAALTPAQEEKPIEVCPDCSGAGGDNNTFTCGRCDGSGGVPATPSQASPGKEVEDLIGRLRRACDPLDPFYRHERDKVGLEAADMLERMAGGWRPIETAPRAHELLELIVDYSGPDSDNAIGDTAKYGVTIGCNGFDHTGDDGWFLAGWSWTQDCFTSGRGVPVAWRYARFDTETEHLAAIVESLIPAEPSS